MIQRALFLLMLYSSPILAQVDFSENPPFVDPPKLDRVHSDRFENDSREDYEVAGKGREIEWEKGILKIGEQAILRKSIQAGRWVKLKCDIQFPELKSEGDQAELKIWIESTKGPGSLIWIRQKRGKGLTRSALFIARSSQDSEKQTRLTPIGKPLVFNGPPGSGEWTICWREGVVSAVAPDQKLVKFAWDPALNSTPSRIAIESEKGTISLRALNIDHSRKLERFAFQERSWKIRNRSRFKWESFV